MTSGVRQFAYAGAAQRRGYSNSTKDIDAIQTAEAAGVGAADGRAQGLRVELDPAARVVDAAVLDADKLGNLT